MNVYIHAAITKLLISASVGKI